MKERLISSKFNLFDDNKHYDFEDSVPLRSNFACFTSKFSLLLFMRRVCLSFLRLRHQCYRSITEHEKGRVECAFHKRLRLFFLPVRALQFQLRIPVGILRFINSCQWSSAEPHILRTAQLRPLGFHTHECCQALSRT